MFRPKAQQFTSVIRIKHRIDNTVNGAPDPIYVDATPALHPCEFRPFYGMEAIQAGQIGVIEGGNVTLWYTPGVKPTDRIHLNDDASLVYEVFSVENVENRNMYLVLKVKRAVNT